MSDLVPGDAPAPGPPPEEAPRYYKIPLAPVFWTYVLIGANVAIALLGLISPEIEALGIKENALVAAGEYWRLLTSTFLHASLRSSGGVAHLGSNMLALYVLGPQVEAPFGARRFLAVYLLSGLLGSALSYLLTSNPSLGASGAIYGLLGALVAFLLRNRHGFGDFGRRRLSNVIGVIVVNLALTLALPFIDLWGHVGGLLGGLALGLALAPVYHVEADALWGAAQVVDASPRWLRLLGVAGVALAVVAVTALGTWQCNLFGCK